MRFTVLGATGFIGSHVAALGRARGCDIICPGRDESLAGRELGHVIYSIGLTSDFRQRPHDTVTAHVTKLQQVLTQSTFDSLVYLSSTRVYSRCRGSFVQGHSSWAVHEDVPIPVLSTDFNDLYNISKLMGESIALSHGSKIKIARLSNVIGPDFNSDNFLISVVRDGVRDGKVQIKTSAASNKDYIGVADVADVLLRLGIEGRQPIYNVASGSNTSNAQLIKTLIRLTGADISIAASAPTTTFPIIDISRLRQDLNFHPKQLDTTLESLVTDFQTRHLADRHKDAA